MTSEGINKLIQDGEKIDVEFKESKDALTKDIYNSVCSFNNRNGGHILLGVSDKRVVIGVNQDKVDKIIKEFITSVNNSQKMYPPLYLEAVPVDLDGKIVIYIRVPEGYQVCRHNGRIWDRSYEGDINITDNSELVFKMYARKQNHPWENMNNEELLRSANLMLVDPEKNREGITLAAVLLFGKDNSIMSVLSQHKTDAIFRVKDKDRYDDRDVVITNFKRDHIKHISS